MNRVEGLQLLANQVIRVERLQSIQVEELQLLARIQVEIIQLLLS